CLFGGTGDFFGRCDFAIVDGHAATRIKTGGGEIEIDELFLFGVPAQDASAAVRSVVDRVEHTDRFAVEGALPTGNVDHRLFGCAVFEFTSPGFVDERTQRFELFIEWASFGRGRANVQNDSEG